MNTYGDDGNIICLVKRCRWRQIDVNVEKVSVGDKINPAKYDLYFFGGGQDQQQAQVSKDLLLSNGEMLKRAVRDGAVVLAICGGYQLLGNYYQPYDREKISGIGLLNIETLGSKKRMVGNIIVKLNNVLYNEIIKIYTWGSAEMLKYLVGFENHSGRTKITSKNTKSLGRVVKGFGNNGDDKEEGAFLGNVFGCYLHGSFLPKNPHFADLLIYLALKRRNNNVYLAPLDDNLEWQAHSSAMSRA